MSKIQAVNLVDVSGPAIAALIAIKSTTLPFRSRVSPRIRIVTPIIGESMTKQSFAEECDVNNILRSYAKNGIMPHVNSKPASYLDVSDFNPDYLSTMNLFLETEEAFSQLPALLRKRFQNDPIQFLQFASDPSNSDEMVKLGLATQKPGAPVAGNPAAGAPDPAGGGSAPA